MEAALKRALNTPHKKRQPPAEPSVKKKREER
jgi:hypothetical protein